MEIYNLIIQTIGSLGFPIVMCLLLIKRMDNQESRHKEEITKMTDALNNNTTAMARYTDSIKQLLAELAREK